MSITHKKKSKSFLQFAYQLHICYISTPNIVYKKILYFSKDFSKRYDILGISNFLEITFFLKENYQEFPKKCASNLQTSSSYVIVTSDLRNKEK